MIQKRNKKKTRLMMVMIAIVFSVLAGFTEAEYVEGATKAGYTTTPHDWSGLEDCGGCWEGYMYCPDCEGDSVKQKSCATCDYDGTLDKWCNRCNGTGVNQKCKNNNCPLVNKDYTDKANYKYNNWEDELEGNTTGASKSSNKHAGTKWLTQDMYDYCTMTPNTYTIKFNANGGTGTMANMSCTYDKTYTLIQNAFTRTSYKFLGWSTSSTATTATYTDKQSISNLTAKANGTVTLYAVWKQDSFTVTYDANGGTGAPANQVFVYNSGAKISSTVPTRTGYTFKNWVATHNTSYTFAPGAAIPSGWGNFTLKAQWNANTYQVTVNPNGGTYNGKTSSTAHSVVTGNSVNVTNPTRTGYTFTGWTISGGDATITDITNGKNVKVLSTNVMMTANWQENEYTVTYHSNGGSTTNTSQVYHYGDAVDLNLVAEKEGYIFVGWGMTPNAAEAISSLSMPDLATSTDASHNDWELTLYAIYSMAVSDIAGHDYPDYTQGETPEVYLVVWEGGNTENFRIYPLTYEYDVSVMKYRYSLDVTDVSDFVSGMQSYCYQVLARDHAGNVGVLDGNGIFPQPDEYLQTVYHYKKDPVTGVWMKFDTTTEMVLEGNVFKPEHITPPAGYQTAGITYPAGYTITDGSYIVTEEAISYAYYEPIEYKLTYNANGGTCDKEYKMVTYSDYYGVLPTPVRRGYTFLGWYTAQTGGTQVLSSHRYYTADNTTVYARWQVNSYRVTYDYWTNGGTAVSDAGADVNYGEAVPLTPTAAKEGWTFVGWSTVPDTTTKLTSLTMSDSDIVLYAIYKKEITITIVEQTDSGRSNRTITKNINNRETEIDFILTEVNEWSGWMLLGWTQENVTGGYPQIDTGGIITLSDSVTLYGLYEKPITISYDSNGAAYTPGSLNKYARFNASGTSFYPSFALANAPELSGSSFVKWQDEAGNRYEAEEEITPTDSLLLTALWDKHPDLIAYNRHFTLEQAQNGEITQAELLSKVTATDEEDGTLANGTSVIVKDYGASIFTGMTTDAVVSITYEAADSFGNTVSRTITVTVTDTTAKKTSRKSYVRFISKDYLIDSTGELRPVSDGGLEETSVWRTNRNYLNLLTSTLSNTKTGVETKKVTAFGGEWEIEVAGSGNWNKKEETWVFTRADIQEMKTYTGIYGHVRNAIDEFLSLFEKCRKS